MSCLFCDMATGKIPVDFILEDENIFAINDISQQAPTHILIIPKAHHESAAELAAKDPVALSAVFNAAAKITQDLGLSGYRSVFNTGESAGQSVFHAHLHLLAGRAFAWPPG